MTTDTELKPLVRALSIITALDRRKAQGRLDEAGAAALAAAEAALSQRSGRVVIAAFRAWREGGLQALDPTATKAADTASQEAAAPSSGRYRDLALRGRG